LSGKFEAVSLKESQQFEELKTTLEDNQKRIASSEILTHEDDDMHLETSDDEELTDDEAYLKRHFN
jgi:hypothetical protein